MAHRINNTIAEILAYEKDKILRPNYGQTSLKDWEPKYDELIKKVRFIEQYSDSVETSVNNQVESNLKQIKSHLSQLVNYQDTQYVSNKQQQIDSIQTQLNGILKYWPHYISVAIEKSGILTNADIKKSFNTIIENLKTETNSSLEKIEKESNKIIEQAKKKANEIETSVRKTAEKVSVQEAQEQFRIAANHNAEQFKKWGIATIVLIVVFIGLIIYLLNVEIPSVWSWKLIYYSIIRLALLTLVSTLISFGLRIVKSHLHMQQRNLHRKRIANSMSAFAESAFSKEQRDLILMELVESVADFGNSGLIGNESDSNSKLTIDNITKSVSTLNGN